jgi:ketosteroid isomerase-like protein
MPTRERVKQLIALVERGKFVEALQEFYAADASMQENTAPPRVGLANLIAHERGVLAAFSEVRTRPVEGYLVDGDRVVINWVFEFVGHDGRTSRMDELAYQLWRGDRIVQERFYYDPAQMRVSA